MPMKKQLFSTLFLFLVFLFPKLVYCSNSEAFKADWKLNQIEQNSAGFLERVGGDPYIIFPSMEKSNYSVRGVQLEILFTPMLTKPCLMELFWHSDYEGFSELRKVFFVLHPNKTGDSHKFFLPLKNEIDYKQFRLDFPGDISTKFQVKYFSVVTDEQTVTDLKHIESFSNLIINDVRPEIIIPYMVKTFYHGLSRLGKDPAFFIAWMLIIFAALFACRKISRDIRKK
jgi:hypothetical protein